jgi:hypothetical protein
MVVCKSSSVMCSKCITRTISQRNNAKNRTTMILLHTLFNSLQLTQISKHDPFIDEEIDNFKLGRVTSRKSETDAAK